MYTGGVSSLAEQIANQLQSPEDPKPLPEKRDSVSMPFPGWKARDGTDKSLRLPESVVFLHIISTMICCCHIDELVFCHNLTLIHLPLVVECVCC